jgi:hypothetical protein
MPSLRQQLTILLVPSVCHHILAGSERTAAGTVLQRTVPSASACGLPPATPATYTKSQHTHHTTHTVSVLRRKLETPRQPSIYSRPPPAPRHAPLQTTEALHAIPVRQSHTTLIYNSGNNHAPWEQSVMHLAPRTSHHTTTSRPPSLTVLSKDANSRAANNSKHVWKCGEMV